MLSGFARPPSLVLGALALGIGVCGACSAFTSYDGLTGGSPEAGDGPTTGPPDGGADTADGGRDAAPDAPGDVQQAPDCAVSKCPPLPMGGWSFVGFEASRGAACPGPLTPLDVVEQPVIGPNACTCSTCNQVQPPSCATGSIGVLFDNLAAPTCSQMAAPLMGALGCQLLGNGLPNAQHVEVTAPAATGGTCSIQTVTNPAGVTATDERVCEGQGCLAGTCGAFQACVMATGQQPCPPGFPQQHVVGTNPLLSCSACSCTLGATCVGTVTLTTNAACTASPLVVPTGTCTMLQGVDYNTYRWDGTATNIVCGSGTPPMGSVTLTSTSTVCCP